MWTILEILIKPADEALAFKNNKKIYFGKKKEMFQCFLEWEEETKLRDSLLRDINFSLK